MNPLRTIAYSVAAVATVLAVSTPAHADPPYAKPDLDVIGCYVVDDPVDYGDGIDWYLLKYTYVNEGYLPTNKSFTVRTQYVWQAGVGNETVSTFTQAPMASKQQVTGQYWVTSHVAVYGLWSIELDAGHNVSEVDEDDNVCTPHVNNS